MPLPSLMPPLNKRVLLRKVTPRHRSEPVNNLPLLHMLIVEVPETMALSVPPSNTAAVAGTPPMKYWPHFPKQINPPTLDNALTEMMVPTVSTHNAVIIAGAAQHSCPHPPIAAISSSPFSRVLEMMMPAYSPHDTAIIPHAVPKDPDPIPTKTPHPRLTARQTGAVFSAPPFSRVPETMVPTVFPHESAIVADTASNVPTPTPTKIPHPY
ncbi:uncharacterized protein ARMOST_10429 [Armillaria ostoyae]|uniref:Uncharacterized protein n=1 Tax=Armillaria ostoyae TaxID=47428 RepID=A0A284REB2_ARMOS|nr:uncharacterized protein ARMOST_10429 [Armillaria ostoyae]